MHWFPWILGLAVVVTAGFGYYGSLLITDIPYLAVPYTPKDFGWPYEEVSFASQDGLSLAGWFVPCPAPSSSTLIIQHGVGSNHGDNLLNTACLYREGRWNLFYYTFRGHGDSKGDHTSLGPLEVLDLAGALKYLKEKKASLSQRIGIYGHSLGAAVALVGAAQFPEIQAVAAESSFATISHTVRRFAKLYHAIPYFPFVLLSIFFTSVRLRRPIGRFDPVKAIGQIAPRPVFLMQGGRDLRMPMSDFESLWEAAKDPKEQLIVPEADHGDLWLVDRETYEKRLVSFFRKAIA